MALKLDNSPIQDRQRVVPAAPRTAEQAGGLGAPAAGPSAGAGWTPLAAKANANASPVFYGKVAQALSGNSESVIVSDALEVNLAQQEPQRLKLNDLSLAGLAALRTEAQRQLTANRPVEASTLAKLNPVQQRQYTALQAALSSDPRAALAVQLQLLNGALTKAPRSTTGQTLLESLHGVASGLTAVGLEGGHLAAQLAIETYVPESISQKGKNTCTATAMQLKLARDNPAEYVRIVGELASPRGEAKLADGSSARRVEGTTFDDGSMRTDSARLWQAAMLQYGSEAIALKDASGAPVKARYDNAKDDFFTPDGQVVSASLKNNASVARLITGLTGKAPRMVRIEDAGLDAMNAALASRPSAPNIPIKADDPDYLKAAIRKLNAGQTRLPEETDAARRAFAEKLGPAAIDAIAEVTATGASVPTAIQYADGDGPHGTHEILVTGVEADRNGRQFITFLNPWGDSERIERAAFQRRLVDVALPG